LSCLDGVLHPQESLIGVLLAIRGTEKREYNESVVLKLPSHGRAVDFQLDPYRSFVKEFQKTTPDTTLVVCWTVKYFTVQHFELNQRSNLFSS
jgi:hypothetical protein